MRPLVGIITSNALLYDTFPVQFAGTANATALREICNVRVAFVPADLAFNTVEELMATYDGFLFPGARANVHPEEYDHPETEAHGPFDHDRDAVTLPLIRACVAAGKPILGICRGFQEIAVAFGATLHPEIRDLPGRDNHRMPPEGSLEDKFSRRHPVTFRENGPFAQMFGATQVETNTLHGQGIDEPGARIIVDGTAPDGTPEALYIKDAPGFAMGVQWHPEWNAVQDPVSRALFAAFGQALIR